MEKVSAWWWAATKAGVQGAFVTLRHFASTWSTLIFIYFKENGAGVEERKAYATLLLIISGRVARQEVEELRRKVQAGVLRAVTKKITLTVSRYENEGCTEYTLLK